MMNRHKAERQRTKERTPTDKQAQLILIVFIVFLKYIVIVGPLGRPRTPGTEPPSGGMYRLCLAVILSALLDND